MNLDERLQANNLLRPLVWGNPAEAMNFAKNHRCYCGQSLTLFSPNHIDIYLQCSEHGKVYESGVIHRAVAEKIKDNELSGAYELRKDDPPKHTEEENLKALGF